MSLDYSIYGASSDDSDRLDEQKQIVTDCPTAMDAFARSGESVESLFGICSKVMWIKVIPIVYNPIDAMNR